ncbi:hypothetical protein AALD01_17345 [Oscillospiraceae bacterium 21-37]
MWSFIVFICVVAALMCILQQRRIIQIQNGQIRKYVEVLDLREEAIRLYIQTADLLQEQNSLLKEYVSKLQTEHRQE